MRDIGKNISALRKRQGLTQDELAEKLFVTRQTVSNYENGRTRPDLDMLVKIAEVFATDVNTLIYGPPLPENRSRERRKFLISTLLLALLFAAAAILHPRFASLMAGKYLAEPKMLLSLLLDPALMLLLGWWAMQAVCLLLKPKPLTGPWLTWAWRGLAFFLLLCLILVLPFAIWLAVALKRVLTQYSVDMAFPQIPVYTHILLLIIRVNIRCPGVYAFFGALLQLLSFSRETPAADS